MASRPIWRGHLRLALVTCPIALHSVTRTSADLHFHYINPKTGHRVRAITLDAETDDEVARRDLVKGYEFEKGRRYVLLNDEDFEQANIETSSTLTVEKFVDLSEIDAIYFDSSYYIVPDGEAGQDVFVVLRDAIGRTHRAALSRVVIAQRERPLAILPMGKGMVCHTLHEPRDLNASGPLFETVADDKPDAQMVQLATQLIERQQGHFEPTDTEDRYESRLRDVIAAKLKGEGVAPAPQAASGGDNVIDLMGALKASLGRGKRPDAKSSQQRSTRRAPRKKSARRKTPSRQRA